MGTLSTFKKAIWAFFKGSNLLPESLLRAAICTTKPLYFRTRIAVANFFLPINSTLLVVGTTFLKV